MSEQGFTGDAAPDGQNEGQNEGQSGGQSGGQKGDQKEGAHGLKRWLRHPLVLLVAVLLGVLVSSQLVGQKQPPQKRATALPPRTVEVLTVQEQPFQSEVIGYGYVEPSIVLPMKAEVTGKVAYLHPGLKQGASIAAGTLVARIDPEDYEVSLKQTQADLDSSRYSLEQLKAEEKTAERSLVLAKKNLNVGKKELERIQALYDRKLIAKSQLEAEEQRVIQLEQSVAELEGQLSSNVSRQRIEQSKIERYQQGVKGQEQTLGRTEITMPFAARIGAVQVERGEFVTAGTPLFEALDIQGVEIEAEISTYEMFALVSHLSDRTFTEEQLLDRDTISHAMRLSARVTVPSMVGAEAIWEARVLRISESIDTMRRTLGIVIGIDNPYDGVIPGKRPPLIKGMYAAVTLHGPKRQAIVIPRKALHEGRVYLATPDNRLLIRPVEVGLLQNEQVVISSGLNAGERVIISDLVPVIEGMPLRLLRSERNEHEGAEEAVPSQVVPSQAALYPVGRTQGGLL